MATKKNAKKEVAPAPVKPKKEVKPKVVKTKKASVKLVSFTVGAVIPTQSYGNIQPSITVEANSIEEARTVVMPVIEDMIRTYAETKPGFLGKVEVTEKVVTPPGMVPVSARKGMYEEVAKTGEVMASSVAAPVAAPVSSPSTEPAKQKPETVTKAEKAISLSATSEALKVIEEQIKNSVKIPEEFKAGLQKLVVEKYVVLANK